MLSGLEIKKQYEMGNIFISDFDEKRLNPNSYNLTLNNELLIYDESILDMKKENKIIKLKIPETGLLLKPGELYLGRTNEKTSSDKYIGCLDGRSSIGRLGLFMHVTAGFGDVGFNGFWTLEILCIKPIIIYPNVEVCQVYFEEITGEYELYKSGKYQNNEGIQPSLLYKDFNKNNKTCLICREFRSCPAISNYYPDKICGAFKFEK